jgi:hypothetical protein
VYRNLGTYTQNFGSVCGVVYSGKMLCGLGFYLRDTQIHRLPPARNALRAHDHVAYMGFKKRGKSCERATYSVAHILAGFGVLVIWRVTWVKQGGGKHIISIWLRRCGIRMAQTVTSVRGVRSHFSRGRGSLLAQTKEVSSMMLVSVVWKAEMGRRNGLPSQCGGCCEVGLTR